MPRSLASMLCTLLLAACQLPPLGERTPSSALPPAEAQSTPLGKAVAQEMAAHPGFTGIDPLPDSLESFASRVSLVRSAQRTLDVQYYIWRNDLTGTLLLEALREAAERGVRVRLLLDDNGIPASLDSTLAALDAHPNVEVRLFNPFVLRHPKFIGYLTDFSRLNHRMHNKSLTADSTATILGGRNIGDEYFAATDGIVFADLDVLAIGPAAADVAHDFDRYWASASAWPVTRIVKPAATDQARALDDAAHAILLDPAAAAYVASLDKVTDVNRLLDGTLPLVWAKTRLVSDDPAKALGKAPPQSLILAQLRDILGTPTRELDLVSPYFVPGETGTGYFTQLAAQGVTVRVLTNSLEATDVSAVHSGYARRRKALLAGGVELFELRRAAGATASASQDTGASPFGSSGSSLHAKTFAVDGQRVFVGSLNFDPRSANLNTELGLVIESPELAQRIETAFWTQVPQLAWQAHLDTGGTLYWTRVASGRTLRYETEPNTTWQQRLSVWFFSILPIEWLL
ncbi:phospholipase D family protein [Paraburkholderia acidisoli]|uniref:Phospholipase D family protein n=1 Tax=Paraburkholderia acidisoli TaxID=2571748 RepID=A0A7Z2GK87_9BURK|nr:phospholipase D family protein [Paraburkholderia acidisoli]QGZ63010.1 phospholipase D family protein [Paraburkholderia acidisoli]